MIQNSKNNMKKIWSILTIFAIGPNAVLRYTLTEIKAGIKITEQGSIAEFFYKYFAENLSVQK